MEEFCGSVEDDKMRGALFDKIWRQGAFIRFKDAIHTNDMEEKWYRLRQEELERIAIAWLEANRISYDKNEVGNLSIQAG